MKQDRFFLVILAVIGLLIIVAVTLFFVQQEPLEFGNEDSPEGVLKNYILSLQLGDYQRAYNYLQNNDDKPDFNTFQQALLRNASELPRSTIRIGDVIIMGNNAQVDIALIHTDNDPFSRDWVENSLATLTNQDNRWFIVNMPYPYWGWDWYIRE